MEACTWRHAFCLTPHSRPHSVSTPRTAAFPLPPFSASTRSVKQVRQCLRATSEFDSSFGGETQKEEYEKWLEASSRSEDEHVAPSEAEPAYEYFALADSDNGAGGDSSMGYTSPQDERRVDASSDTSARAVAPLTAQHPGASGVSGSGLLRSPTTGGVQSATSAHGLPDPAVAVRNLVAQSKHAHLCTVMSRMHHRRTGYPFASVVDFANDASGHPIFCLSSLAIHARNLLADPRCTLVVQIPGWSGLADARVTIFGEAQPVAPEFRDWASKVFASRHQQEASEQWGNSHFFRIEAITDIYFVGGFGTVAWIDAIEYLSVQPDRIASENSEKTLKTLNTQVAGMLRDSLSQQVHEGVPAVDSVSFIAVDSKGVDIRVQQDEVSNVRRLSFNCARPIETVEEAQRALEDMIGRGTLPSGLVSNQV